MSSSLDFSLLVMWRRWWLSAIFHRILYVCSLFLFPSCRGGWALIVVKLDEELNKFAHCDPEKIKKLEDGNLRHTYKVLFFPLPVLRFHAP